MIIRISRIPYQRTVKREYGIHEAAIVWRSTDASDHAAATNVALVQYCYQEAFEKNVQPTYRASADCLLS